MKFSYEIMVRNVITVLVLAAVFTFLGIYDTDTLPLLWKFLFWAVIMMVGAIATTLVEPWVFGRLMRDQHPMLQLVVIASLITIPIALGLAGMNTNFAFTLSLTNWVLQFISVWFIAFIIVIGRYIAPQVLVMINSGISVTETSLSSAQGFLQRLPIRFRDAELYAVSSEGHYLRVHTHRGEELILMRLSDAVRELAGADGLQIHRSWWVAREGIADHHSKNGKRTLILKSGVKAPVSRSFVKALKAAGLDS